MWFTPSGRVSRRFSKQFEVLPYDAHSKDADARVNRLHAGSPHVQDRTIVPNMLPLCRRSLGRP